jgi:hypothetical protein
VVLLSRSCSPAAATTSRRVLGIDERSGTLVAVGDELRKGREVHGKVGCSESVAGEPLFGGETPMYPWCRTSVGDMRVHFGGDPSRVDHHDAPRLISRRGVGAS